MHSFPVRFLAEAEAELLAEYDWYSEHAGQVVANRFRDLVRQKIRRIARNPEVYRTFDGIVRRCLLGSFPHALLFVLHEGTVVVVAVMHLKRRPGYWKQRVRSPGA